MRITQLDHLVLTVNNIEDTCSFYTAVLGMEAVEFGGGRKALVFGSQKINLHKAGNEFVPHAGHPVPGSADLCFLASQPMEKLISHVNANRVEIIEGPVERTGADGPILSIYFRDPDGNLVEIANQLSTSDQIENHAA